VRVQEEKQLPPAAQSEATGGSFFGTGLWVAGFFDLKPVLEGGLL
jgi:hypothetical protein